MVDKIPIGKYLNPCCVNPQPLREREIDVHQKVAHIGQLSSKIFTSCNECPASFLNGISQPWDKSSWSILQKLPRHYPNCSNKGFLILNLKGTIKNKSTADQHLHGYSCFNDTNYQTFYSTSKDYYKEILPLSIHPMKVQNHIWNNIQSIQWASLANRPSTSRKERREGGKEGRQGGRKEGGNDGNHLLILLSACLERLYNWTESSFRIPKLKLTI